MNAQEVKVKRKELQARQAELTKRLAADGKDRALRLELAAVKEDLVDCERQLRQLMPRHHISAGRQMRGEVALDRDLYKKWFAQVSGEGDNSADVELLRQSVRAAAAALSSKQRAYWMDHLDGMRVTDIAQKYGVWKGTVSRTLARAKKSLEQYAKAIHAFRQAGGINLSDEACMQQYCEILTTKQQMYISLYYGEWMTCSEVGALLGVDKSSVYRSIQDGLYKLYLCAPDLELEFDVGRLEDLIICHYNGLRAPEDREVHGCQHIGKGKDHNQTDRQIERKRREKVCGFRVRLLGRLMELRAVDGKRLWRNSGPASGRLRVWLEGLRRDAETAYPGPDRWKRTLLATLSDIFTRIKMKFGRDKNADYH